MRYFVKPVVCDYGVFELANSGEHKLIVICNSNSNAKVVADVLNKDDKHEIAVEQGEWIDETKHGYVECPFCSEITTCEGKLSIHELHYCWNCGAKLKEARKTE